MGKGPGSLKSTLGDAIHYWEPRRAAYSLLLTAVVLAWLILTWPHFRPAFTLDSLLKLVVLGLIANLAYSVVYAIDIPLKRSSIRSLWVRRRWILWTLEMLFAILVTNYWIADEIYPYWVEPAQEGLSFD